MIYSEVVGPSRPALFSVLNSLVCAFRPVQSSDNFVRSGIAPGRFCFGKGTTTSDNRLRKAPIIKAGPISPVPHIYRGNVPGPPPKQKLSS